MHEIHSLYIRHRAGAFDEEDAFDGLGKVGGRAGWEGARRLAQIGDQTIEFQQKMAPPAGDGKISLFDKWEATTCNHHFARYRKS